MVTKLFTKGPGDNGLCFWTGSVDDKGYRTYKAKFRVLSDFHDGPANVLQTPGLPVPGSQWLFYGDVDIWAFCKWTTSVSPVVEGQANYEWIVEKEFSTKPDQRCQNTPQQDPLLEPWKVNIDSIRYTEEATFDRFGKPITNSAWEPVRGKEVERDRNRSTVKLEKNVGDFSIVQLALSMRDTVNAFPLWGCPARTIKLSKVSAPRHFYGNCLVYFGLSLDFDIDLRGWDKDLNDRATKILHGHWGFLPGSGCTLVITASTIPVGTPPVTGAILTAAIGSGGSGYPANSSVALTVNGGVKGVVTVLTNNSGVATSVAGITTAGSAYPASGTQTTQVNSVSWILDDINGKAPDPNNPTHFDVAKDRNGENMKDLILNGHGLPSIVVTGSGKVFISVKDGNVGNGLSDTASWISLSHNPAGYSVPTWNDTTTYNQGDVVFYLVNAHYYVLQVDTTTSNAPDAGTFWVDLGTSAVSDGGNYSPTTTYSKGQYVADSSSSSAGTIHVEFYDESDFLQLGVLADLTSPY